jgi:hypothetical protein
MCGSNQEMRRFLQISISLEKTLKLESLGSSIFCSPPFYKVHEAERQHFCKSNSSHIEEKHHFSRTGLTEGFKNQIKVALIMAERNQKRCHALHEQHF